MVENPLNTVPVTRECSAVARIREKYCLKYAKLEGGKIIIIIIILPESI